MSLHLYEITEQFRQLNELAESDDIPPEVIRDTLESIEGDFDDKAINVAKFILNLEASAENINAAAKSMTARAKRMEARAESLRQYMLFNFQALSKKKLTSEWFDLVVKNNTPAVAVDDINQVPAEFLKASDGPPALIDGQRIEYTAGEDGAPRSWTIYETRIESVDEGIEVEHETVVKRGVVAYEPATVVKAAVAREHKAGREVPGCHPEQGQRLDIVV
jgi:hypothetical protein